MTVFWTTNPGGGATNRFEYKHLLIVTGTLSLYRRDIRVDPGTGAKEVFHLHDANTTGVLVGDFSLSP